MIDRLYCAGQRCWQWAFAGSLIGSAVTGVAIGTGASLASRIMRALGMDLGEPGSPGPDWEDFR